MLCYFLPYSIVHQLYVYRCPLPPDLPPSLQIPPLQVITELSSLCYTAASH